MNVVDIVRLGVAAAAIMLLAACTSTEATLDPNALQSQPAAPTSQAAAPAPTTQSPAPTAPVATATPDVAPLEGSIQLASVLGAPSQAIRYLTVRMIERGPSKKLTIVENMAPDGSYTMRGFLSTSPEQGRTFVYYSWDISNREGVALNRLTGRQPATGKGEGWAAVTQADMEAIADQTLDSFSAWRATR